MNLRGFFRKVICLFLAFTMAIFPAFSPRAQAAAVSLLSPGLTAPTPLLKGVQFNSEDPFRLDFVLDPGAGSTADDAALKSEASRLVGYFLASLTTPAADMWVNLSPYEKDRIVPEAFGQTEMGRDLLAQDYILKQLTASLLYPENKLGRTFWDKVYARVWQVYGTVDIPQEAFHKVWIVPESAQVQQYNGAAFLGVSRLKVMLDDDYKAMAHVHQAGEQVIPEGGRVSPSEVMRELIIPVLEKEVNEGAHFRQLRQIYSALVLAAWFKRYVQQGLLGRSYVDRNLGAGIEIEDKTEKQQIYARYLESVKKGVFNYIKEEPAPVTGEMVPRKYVSGGAWLGDVDRAMRVSQAASADVLAAGLKDAQGWRRVSAYLSPIEKNRMHVDDKAMSLDNIRKSFPNLRVSADDFPTWQAQELFHSVIVPLLSDEFPEVRREALLQVARVVRANPDLITESLLGILTTAFQDKTDSVRAAWTEAIDAVLNFAGTHLTTQRRDHLFVLFSSIKAPQRAAAEARMFMDEGLLAELTSRRLSMDELFSFSIFDTPAEIAAKLTLAAREIKARPEGFRREWMEMALDYYERQDDPDQRAALGQGFNELVSSEGVVWSGDVLRKMVELISFEANVEPRNRLLAVFGRLAAKDKTVLDKAFDRESLVRGNVDQRTLSALIAGETIMATKCHADLLRDMGGFVVSEENGLGLEEADVSLISRLFLHNRRIAEEEAGRFFGYLKAVPSQFSRRQLLAAAVDYNTWFREGKFWDFFQQNYALPPYEMEQSLKQELIRGLGIEDVLNGKLKNEWRGIQRLLRMASRYSTIRKDIIRKIIVAITLEREVWEDGFKQYPLVEQERIVRDNKDSILPLLRDTGLTLLLKRRLIQILNVNDLADINMLRKRAAEFSAAKSGSTTKNEGLSGDIRVNIHSKPSKADREAVSLYKRVLLTEGREGVEQLKALGYTVRPEDILSAPGDARTRQNMLTAADALLESLDVVYGRKQTASGIKNVLYEFEQAVFTDQTAGIVAEVGAILADKDKDPFVMLGRVVAVQEKLFALITNLRGEALYHCIQLNLKLGVLVYALFNSLSAEDQTSLDTMEQMLLSAQFEGYGEGVLQLLVRELSLIRQQGDLDFGRIYSVVTRGDRFVKRHLGSMIQLYLKTSEVTARALGFGEDKWPIVENFSANMIRGDNIFLLSQIFEHWEKNLGGSLGQKRWQVVVSGQMKGPMEYVTAEQLLDQDQKKWRGKILLMEQLPDTVAIPGGVSGIVTLKRDSLLSHPVIRVRQRQIPFFVCPDKQQLAPWLGKNLSLTIESGRPVMEDLKEFDPESVPVEKIGRVAPLEADLTGDVVLTPQEYRPGRVGNKAYYLSRLDELPLGDSERRAKHISSSNSFWDRVLSVPVNRERRDRIFTLIRSLNDRRSVNVSVVLTEIRAEIMRMEIPDGLLARLKDDIRRHVGEGLVFVRSSTNVEDLENYAGTGLYLSSGAVDPTSSEALREAVLSAQASVWSDHAYLDRESSGVIQSKVHMANAFQAMVASEYSYVIHTVNPLSNDPDEMLIEIVQGLGEALVSGSEEFQGVPHGFVINKTTGMIRQVSYANKDFGLFLSKGRIVKRMLDYSHDLFANKGAERDYFLQAIFKKALMIEKSVAGGVPQDIEGAIEKSPEGYKLVFLQTRSQQGVNDRAQLMAPVHNEDVVALDRPAAVGGIDLNDAWLRLDVFGEGAEVEINSPLGRMPVALAGLKPSVLAVMPFEAKAFLGINSK